MLTKEEVIKISMSLNPLIEKFVKETNERHKREHPELWGTFSFKWGKRKCKECNEEKHISQYYKHSVDKSGREFYYTTCKECERKIQLKKYHNLSYDEKKEYQIKCGPSKEYAKRHKLMSQYGITLEQFYEMYSNQNNACYICKRLVSADKICVDHDHLSGKVRKLLCHQCNSLLGFAKDDRIILEECIKYLGEHETNN